ncbi:hypothetical protein ACSBR2_005638 [Camellia fascicularis]
MLSMVGGSGFHVVDFVVGDKRIAEVDDGVDKARGGLFGDFATSFDQLRWYLETAMRTNPGSVFELDVDESSGYFRRLFVAFHGCLYDFQFCRPLLFVDGAFLKGHYKGHLLAVTSKDGNQNCFSESYKESVYPVPSSEDLTLMVPVVRLSNLL